MTIVNPRQLRARIRRAYWTAQVRRTAADVGVGARVNFRTKVTPTTRLGANFNSNGLVVRGRGALTIGDNFHCGDGCDVVTDIHNFEGTAVPYDDTYLTRDVVIGDNVWFGINVCVLGGVTIGDGAIIQAGSVVVRDVPRCGIAGGHPAQVFSSRDVDHYDAMVRRGAFH